jgi:phosphofructokinase-like protein
MPVIGLLTAGGDCPGLNAVIRGVTVRATKRHNAEVVGIKNGWEGLMEGETVTLDRDAVRGILVRGGTILGSSRMDPYVHGDGYASCAKTIEQNGIDSLIVVGGDGTLRSALRLSKEGLPIVGVPKTIDNDINGTDQTFGFSTAVQVATDAIDRLVSTAESHNRVIVVEVMGRTKGWIATCAGMAGGADAILIPELPYDLDEVAEIIRRRHRHGQRYTIIVVAEGVAPPPGLAHAEVRKDAFGFDRLGGVSYQVAEVLEEMTGFETRVTVLGHVQRGGTPDASDRVLATRFGVAAADLAVAGETGVMVASRGLDIVAVPMEEACAEIRGVPDDLFEAAATFFE